MKKTHHHHNNCAHREYLSMPKLPNAVRAALQRAKEAKAEAQALKATMKAQQAAAKAAKAAANVTGKPTSKVRAVGVDVLCVLVLVVVTLCNSPRFACFCCLVVGMVLCLNIFLLYVSPSYVFPSVHCIDRPFRVA